MNAGLRMLILALLVVGIVGFATFVGGGKQPASADTGAAEDPSRPRFESSAQCAKCHEEVWREWYGSHHQIAYLNPEVRLLSDDFRNKECQACHLPRPVAQTGYGRRTLHRTTRPDEGVGCLSCHLGPDGEILGRNTVADAPCRPQASPTMASVDMCASCHNQHWTTDQWRETPYATEGVGCNECHMPQVTRANGRAGRGHVFYGGHDLPTLRRAVELSARVEGEELVAVLDNVAAGHNFPTEERSRAADVEVRFDDGAWTRMHRFRLPYRDEPLPDTTLPHGQSHEMRATIPGDATRAVVRLWYRLTPFVGDDDRRSAIVFEQELRRGTEGWIAAPMRLPDPPTDSAFRPLPDPAVLPDVAPPAAMTRTDDAWPALPELTLTPRLEALRAVLAAGPSGPDDARRAELRDLLETAFVPGAADKRTATLARRGLLAEDDAVWALEEALSHDDAAVRSLAAYELGRLGNPASAVPLLLRLKYEVPGGAPSTVAWLVDALDRLGNRAGLPYLSALFARTDVAELAGQRALEILGRAGREVPEEPTWAELAEALDALHTAWVEDATRPEDDTLLTARIAQRLLLLEEFQLRGVDETRFVLARLGTAVLPSLRDALRAQEPYLRSHALEIVREMGAAARPLTDVLIPLLGDELSRVDAVVALGRVGAREALPHLLARLDADDLGLRTAVAGALGGLGDPAAVEPLREVHGDPDQPLDVRVYAAFSLAQLDAGGSERGWLQELRDRGGYHDATLAELLERL